MEDLTQHPDRLPNCDCHECAIHERNRLLAENAAALTTVEYALAKLDRLRAENEALKRSRQMDANEAKSREDVLRAENERLRESLHKIAHLRIRDGSMADVCKAIAADALTPNAKVTRA